MSLYADDITIFVKNETHVLHVLKILNEFSRVSGLKLNETKTEAMWIGSSKTSQDKVCNLKCKLYPNNIVKSLGINFSSTRSINDIPQNWESKVQKN